MSLPTLSLDISTEKIRVAMLICDTLVYDSPIDSSAHGAEPTIEGPLYIAVKSKHAARKLRSSRACDGWEVASGACGRTHKRSRHRRRHVQCAGMGVPVLQLTACPSARVWACRYSK